VGLAGEAIAAAGSERRRLRIRPGRAVVADLDAVEQAIEEAFEALFDTELSVEARAATIEGGEGLVETLHQVEGRYPVETVDIRVDSIRLLDEAEAEVHFAVLVNRFGMAGLQETGHAVRTDDGWKVARATWCRLALHAGVFCPPSQQAT
jgi:hypothetical protein